jgi:hypothetical protein
MIETEIRNHEYMISNLLEELSKNYNKIYNLKGICKQKRGESQAITEEELRNVKYMIDTKLPEILQNLIDLKYLIGQLNEKIDIIRYKPIKINQDIRFCYKDDDYGDEFWTYSDCMIQLRKISKLSKLTTQYNKSMCDTIRRPFTVLGYEIKRICNEYISFLTELKKRQFTSTIKL